MIKQHTKLDKNYNEYLYKELDDNDKVIYWINTKYYPNSNNIKTIADSNGWIRWFKEDGMLKKEVGNPNPLLTSWNIEN